MTSFKIDGCDLCFRGFGNNATKALNVKGLQKLKLAMAKPSSSYIIVDSLCFSLLQKIPPIHEQDK